MLDSSLLKRVDWQEKRVVEDVNQSVAFTALPAIAAIIRKEAERLMHKYSPDEDDPFSLDALQSLMLSQVASFLTYDDLDQMEVIQPHMLDTDYARFFFDVEPLVPTL